MQDPGIILGLCDNVVEALVLFDHESEQSAQDLMAAAEALVAAFEDVSEDHPSAVLCLAAEAMVDGELDKRGDIEVAIDATRKLVECGGTDVGTDDVSGVGEASQRPAVPALAGDEELLRDFAVRAVEYLDDVDECLLLLEVDPAEKESVDTCFRAFHTIKGMAGFLGLGEISTCAHDAEGLLEESRSNRTPVESAAVQALFTTVDSMRRMVCDATGVSSSMNAGERQTGDSVASDEAESGQKSAPTGTPGAGMVRVDESRLDALLDTIGELVIAESMVSAQARSDSSSAASDLHVDRLDKITRELQQMATSLRMVPLKATFRRMARLVRDLSQKSGKPVDFVTSGEETELDKTVVDRIQDPLVHALRNAIDHGLEDAEQRVAAGKPLVGRIDLKAYHAGGSIHIEISDDGGGLDREKILARARERGLVAGDETPDDRTLLNFVFDAGFSTAEEVTDVSGRGVGTDVVRRTVEDLRGHVELHSEPGVGTTMSVRLPMTLAIIDGMVARVGAERYVIPVLSIERSVRPTADQLTSVQGKGTLLVTDTELIPIVKLHRLFSTAGAQCDPTDAVVIIVSEAGMRAGLLACELLGQQQTVIKPLGEGLPDQPGVAGGAIMPDGRVGLILDAAGLVRLANERGGDSS